MGTGDVRVLARAGLVLLAASAVRFGLAAGGSDGTAPVGDESVLGALIEASEEAAATESARTRPLAPGERIDPNRASVDELDRLPGVGPALAGRIARERENGPYREAADLERVAGIGPAKRTALEPHMELPSAPARPRPGTNAGSRPRSWDLARMSAAELEELDGIGPVLAGRIVEYRDAGGPLRTAEDLLAVSGIGPATLDRILRSLERRPRPP